MNDRVNSEIFTQKFYNSDSNPDEVAEQTGQGNTGILSESSTGGDHAFTKETGEGDEFQVTRSVKSQSISEILDQSGVNWSALFWLIVFLTSSGMLIFNEVNEISRKEHFSRLEVISSKLDADIREIGYQALLASTGDIQSFSIINTLRNEIDSSLSSLKLGDSSNNLSPVPVDSITGLITIEQYWTDTRFNIDLLLNNQNSAEIITSKVVSVNELTSQLLEKANQIVSNLIQGRSDIELINLAGQQRFLSQRIKAGMNEFANGSSGWEITATQFGQDVKLFGQITNVLLEQGGSAIATQVKELKKLYGPLVTSTDEVMNNVGDYFVMRSSAEKVMDSSNQMKGYTKELQNTFMHSDSMILGIENLPLILRAIVLISLFALLWSVISYSRKFARLCIQNFEVSENAIIKLLDEMGNLVTGIKTAIGKMNQGNEGVKPFIATLLTRSDLQSQELSGSADDVMNITCAINEMSESVTRSGAQARLSAEVAQKGGDAVKNIANGMNKARNQMQAIDRLLKQLAKNSWQVNEIINLIQDTNEQTNILSLNASIQAAMAGEAGKGFAMIVEEIQKLAERSAYGSSEIMELVKNMQQDANSAIAAMAVTTEEIASGSTTATEASHTLNKIESVSQDWLETIGKVANSAQNESKAVQAVTERIKSFQQVTSETDNNISQVAVALEQISSIANQLKQSIADFKLLKT